jgi:hypothetical protein
VRVRVSLQKRDLEIHVEDPKAKRGQECGCKVPSNEAMCRGLHPRQRNQTENKEKE